jgi:hypothetical protein
MDFKSSARRQVRGRAVVIGDIERMIRLEIDCVIETTNAVPLPFTRR